MADQLLQLGLDDKAYMDGIRRVMKQSQADFKRMQAGVAAPIKSLGRLAMGGGAVAMAFRVVKGSIQAYARTSEQARREVDALVGSIDGLQAALGSDLMALFKGSGTGLGGLLDRISAARTQMSDELGAAIGSALDSTWNYESRLDALRLERELNDRAVVLERERVNRIERESRLLNEQEEYLRAIGATKMADEAGIMRQFLASRNELRDKTNAGKITREDMDSGIAAAERLRDAKMAKVQSEARDKADREWLAETERWMQEESDATREAIEAAQDRADSIKELSRDEDRLRLEILQAKGDELGFERESLRQRRERALQDIRTNDALNEAERQAAEARIQSQYDTLEGLMTGGRGGRSSLESIASGTAGFQSVIAGAFGSGMGGNSPQVESLKSIKSATAASVELENRQVALLVQIAAQRAGAVYV